MSERPFILRLIIPFAIMIVIVIGVCGAVIYWAGQRTVLMQQIQDLDRLTLLVRERVPDMSAGLSAQQQAEIHALAQLLGTRITLIAGNGEVLLDSSADRELMENHNSRSEVIQARREGIGDALRRSDTTHERTVYVAELLDRARPDGVVIRLSYPKRVWAELGLPVWAIVVAATVTAATLMACLAVILQRRWIGPVRELAAAADQMAAGRWQTRVEPAGADQVQFLASRFNVMAAQAEKQLAELNHQRADLQSLVDSLPDPILLSDPQRRIVVINAPAARLLQLKPAQAVGRKIVEVVNEEAILSVLETVPPAESRNSAAVMREIRLQRGGQHVTYQAVATRAKAGGVLLVLRNVSAMAAAVQMKTDFVANASHELRTPIAAIKVAFETLRDVYEEDPQQTSRCITIIDGHLRRLEEMLSDLLDLSRVENPDLKPQITPVHVPDLISHLRQTLGSMARQKGVELRFAIENWEGNRPFNSDPRLLNLILKNLVENSIKFTPPQGTVSVAFARSADAAQPARTLLEIRDTGIGIPPEHQQRVFERFYQVDPARSGAAGRGTGLGLAIVKHAVHALGGSVELDSAPGQGTTVTCTLPDLPTSTADDPQAAHAALEA